MFLKFLDDLELQREDEAALARQEVPGRLSSRPIAGAIGPPIRRASPATSCSPSSIRTKRMRPDGKKGPGLFAYLRGLTSSNGDDRRDVIATVFQGRR